MITWTRNIFIAVVVALVIVGSVQDMVLAV